MTFAKKLLLPLRDNIIFNLGGGPHFAPVRYVVNFFKALTFLYIIILMYITGNWSQPMKLYLFLHGSYGLCWLLKDFTFPDATFKKQATIPSLVSAAVFLIGYWCIPIPLALWGPWQVSTNKGIFLVGLYLGGLTLMMGSDFQKTKTLEQRKGLISTGFFKTTRNPNYLGELMIYSSFAICADHWFGYIQVYGLAFGLLFMTNMYLKDKLSYEMKEGWEKYSRSSYMLLPKLFASDILNGVFYGAALMASVYTLRG